MIKVCFIYDGETNEKFLEILSKMTPNRSGKWKDLVGVTNPDKADFCIIQDRSGHTCPDEKCIYVGAHPKIPNYDTYVDFGTKGVARLDYKDTFGFGEWWLKYDYDELSDMKRPEKTKDLCCILSDAEGRPDHLYRKEYMERYCSKHSVDLYGHINPTGSMIKHYKGKLGIYSPTTYWFGKEDVLGDYKYTLEFDNATTEGTPDYETSPTQHYFSERFFDDILLWTTPIGVICSTNLGDYLPEGSFRYASFLQDGDDVQKMIKEEPSWKALDQARDLLLNKYQVWARIHKVIHSL